MASIAELAGAALTWKTVSHAGVRIIYLARLAVLAWLLGPDDFGLLAVSLVLLDLATRLTNLGLVPALVQRKDARDRDYHVAWTLGLTRAAVAGFVVIVLAPVFAELFAEPRATPIMRVLAVVPLLEAAQSIRVVWLTRELRFRRLAFVRLPGAVVDAVVAVATATEWGVWALVFGKLLGMATTVMMSYTLAPYRPTICFDREAARALIAFGRWILVIGIVTMIGNAGIRLIITRGLGTEALGVYYLAMQIAMVPMDLAAEVVGGVTFPLYARLQSDARKVRTVFRSVMTAMMAILVPICGLGVGIAPALVEYVLGPKWHGTVPVIRLLLVAAILDIVGEAFRPLLHGLGRAGKVAVLEVVQAGVLLTAALALIGAWGVTGAAVAWLPALAASQTLAYGFTAQLLDRPLRGLGLPATALLAITIAGAGIGFACGLVMPGFAGLLASIVLSGGFMVVAIWGTDRWLGMGLAAAIERVFPRMAALWPGARSVRG